MDPPTISYNRQNCGSRSWFYITLVPILVPILPVLLAPIPTPVPMLMLQMQGTTGTTLTLAKLPPTILLLSICGIFGGVCPHMVGLTHPGKRYQLRVIRFEMMFSNDVYIHFRSHAKLRELRHKKHLYFLPERQEPLTCFLSFWTTLHCWLRHHM